MKAPDILAATHKQEETGMDRSQCEAIASMIAAAVEPLATKADIARLETDIAELRKDTKADLKALEQRMASKKDVESLKVWLVTGLLGLTGSLLAIAASIALGLSRIILA